MKITIDTPVYNHRRFSLPYIAVIKFDADPKGVCQWGNFVGDRTGSKGLLVIDAAPGDIIMTGQKDYRQPKNSTPEYFQIGENGELNKLSGKAEAYKLALI